MVDVLHTSAEDMINFKAPHLKLVLTLTFTLTASRLNPKTPDIFAFHLISKPVRIIMPTLWMNLVKY